MKVLKQNLIVRKSLAMANKQKGKDVYGILPDFDDDDDKKRSERAKASTQCLFKFATESKLSIL